MRTQSIVQHGRSQGGQWRIVAQWVAVLLVTAGIAHGPAVADTVTLSASQDAWIDQADHDTNHGTDTGLNVKGRATNKQRALVQFDLSSIPACATVSDAKLRLHVDTNSLSADVTHYVHRLSASWSEAGVTWNSRDGTSLWSTGGGVAGTDFESTATDTATTGTGAGTVEWDVTADVALFVAGTATNDGWLVKHVEGGTNNDDYNTVVRYASRENATAANQPQLEVTFAANDAACDDANPCTDDTCTIAGCSHTANTDPCDDGLYCDGTDTCSGGACQHSGDPCAGGAECDDLCDEGADSCLAPAGTPCTADGNPCTDDVCDGAGACGVDNADSCDDGLYCDGADTCSGGTCQHSGDPCAGGAECANACDEGADSCFNAVGTPCTADGNPCTDDVCNGSGACGVDNTDPCDDGLYCDGTDTCSGGACQHSGDPCAGGAECANACNEAADNCLSAAGTACTADGNPCTDDVCDGSGTCGVDNNDPCDDDSVCTQVDQCSGGVCVGSSLLDCGDDNACTQDTCDPVAGCQHGSALASNCLTAQKSLLLLKQKGGTKDKLIWKWIRGEAISQAELSDPTSGAIYTLCLFAGETNALIASISVQPDSAKWKVIGDKGYLYKDRSLAEAGIRKILVKGSHEARAKALVKGKGANLPDPSLGDVPLPVTAQLLNDETGACMEATYGEQSVIKNTSSQFKARNK